MKEFPPAGAACPVATETQMAFRGAPTSSDKLAHEIKTPLSAMLLAAEIMKEERLGPIGSERYLGYARDIHAMALHALAVVDLMVAGLADGIEQAKAEPAAPVDIGELIAGLVGSLQPLAERAGITISDAAEPDIPPVPVNETRLRQIILNLLTNAVKSTPPGGLVQVRVWLGDDGGVLIEVQNTSAERPQAQDHKAWLPGIGLPLASALASEMGLGLAFEAPNGSGVISRLAFPPCLEGHRAPGSVRNARHP